ncbi:MAG: helix-turn-helix transcriptional regulator [Jatrophihabitans sp.]
MGRSSELTRLHELLDPRGDQPASHAVLLTGDAGVGKSRLLREFGGWATGEGALVLVGHCLDLDGGALPYLPFSDAFGRLSRERPDAAQHALEAAPAIARLLPARRTMGGAEPADHRVDRSVLYEAVHTALTALAADQPVVFVIEDAHWADESSRHLISFLLARQSGAQLHFVVSYRSEDLHRRHPLRATAAEWARLDDVERMPLSPFGAADVRTLIFQLHPGPIPASSIQTIVDRAEGNAFFTEELVAVMDDSAALPTDLADLLLVRVERLSGETRQVVRAVSVAGRRVSHALLAAVVDLPDQLLEDSVRAAVEANVLIPRGNADYAFRHALLAEVVYEDLLPGERVRLHAAYAAVLAKGEIPGTAAELARHARLSYDQPTALQASIRAGDDALAVAAPWEAMLHFDTALALWPSVHPDADATDEGLIDLTLTAAEAMSAAGHPFRAQQLLAAAIISLPRTADPKVRQVLLHEAATTELSIGMDAQALLRAEEALSLTDPSVPNESRARALAQHARTAIALNRAELATEEAHAALEMARELGLPETEASARETLARIGQRAGSPDEAERWLLEAVDRARTGGSRSLNAQLRSRIALAFLYYDLGRIDDATVQLHEAIDRGSAAGMPWSVHPLDARVLLTLVEYNRGNWDEAARVGSVTGESPPPFAEAALDAASTHVKAGRGNATLLELLSEVRPWWDKDPMIAVNFAGPAMEMYLATGEPTRALDLFDEIVDVVVEHWINPLFLGRIRLTALAVGVAASAASGWTEAERGAVVTRLTPIVATAREAAGDRVRPNAARPLGPEGLAWFVRLNAEWLRLRWLAGIDAPDEQELISAWRAALDSSVDRYAYEHARTQARLAAVLRAVGEVDEARTLADTARATAKRLGAQPLLAELRELGGSARRGAKATSDALTPREREVLALVAAGRTNRQIGRALFISEKTASVHVSNILAKLGAGSRTEAAAIARRDGLLPTI